MSIEEEQTMILRLWSGWTTAENADAYDRLLNGTIAPGIIDRGIDGLLAFDVWRRDPAESGDEVEFLTAMVFRDTAAVEEFTGGDVRSSVVPPAARDLLTRFDEHSRHYDHVREHRGADPR